MVGLSIKKIIQMDMSMIDYIKKAIARQANVKANAGVWLDKVLDTSDAILSLSTSCGFGTGWVGNIFAL